MAQAGYKCLVRRAGVSTSTSSEAFTSLGGNKFQITSAARRCVDIDTAFHLKDTLGTVAWSRVTAADFAFGEFTVTGVTGALTFYGSYLPLTTSADVIAEAKNYSLSESTDLLDTSVFSAQFKKRISGLRDVSLSVDLNLNATDMPSLATLAGTGALTVVEVSNSGFTPLFRAYAKLESLERSGSVDGLIEATVSFLCSAQRHTATNLSAAPNDRAINS